MKSESVSCWSCLTLQPHGLQPARLLCLWNCPGKNIGVDRHSLLQGIFTTQGSNPGLLHCRQILYHLSHQVNLRSTLDPAIILLDICPEKIAILKDICTAMFIAAIFTKAKTWKQSRCLSRDKQIKKLWYIDTMEYYLALKWIGFN